MTLQQLAQVNEVLSNIENSAENNYEAGLHEDKLQSRIDIMEAQVAFYMKRGEEQSNGDELDSLRVQLVRVGYCEKCTAAMARASWHAFLRRLSLSYSSCVACPAPGS